MATVSLEYDSFRMASDKAKSLTCEQGISAKVRRGESGWLVVYDDGGEPSPRTQSEATKATPIPNTSPPTSKTTHVPNTPPPYLAIGGQKVCVDCGTVIPSNRIEASPDASRCVSCQTKFESSHDTRAKVNEGLAGTREDHKKMRSAVWSDIRSRGR